LTRNGRTCIVSAILNGDISRAKISFLKSNDPDTNGLGNVAGDFVSGTLRAKQYDAFHVTGHQKVGKEIPPFRLVSPKSDPVLTGREQHVPRIEANPPDIEVFCFKKALQLSKKRASRPLQK
jgi:hypothetical protein